MDAASGSAVATGALPLPPLLTLAGPVPMVGRQGPLDVLGRAWADGAAGPRRLVLVAGEAGAGKTRLLTEFARQVHDCGGTVLYGTCSEEQTVPYQPFAEAFDHVLTSIDPSAIVEQLGPDAVALAPLVPRRLVSTGTPDGNASDAERSRLFGAVVTAVATLAASRPVLLVIDDLHWARRPTIDLLIELVRDQALRGVLVVCVYRSTPADTGDPLRSALPELRRLPGVTRVGLSGLDRDGIEEFVVAAAGHGSDGLDAAVDLLVRETDGNAFLLVELWLHLVDTGRLTRHGDRWTISRALAGGSTPEGVQDVVGARLARLAPAAREALEVAAVAGPTFDALVLAAVTGWPVDEVVAVLDGAVASRVIDEAGAGGYRFAHELIRRSIVDRLGGAHRRHLHLAVARALDTGSAMDPITEIAAHLVAAVPLVDVGEAVAATVRAAEAATAAYAYDDAARLLDQAVAISAGDRVELLLRVADAAMRAGHVVRAKARCVQADRLAQRTGDVGGRIAAALGYGEAAWRDAAADPAGVQLLRAVLPLAPDPTTAVRLQAALTRALALSGENDAAWVLLEDTLMSARSLDDAYARRVAFDAMSSITWTPPTAARQLVEMRAAAEAERASGNIERERHALSKSMYGTILTGDLEETRRIATRHQQLANTIRQPLFTILDRQVHALLATGEGRFAEAEALAEAADELSRSMSSVAAGAYGVQVFSLRREQGRLDEARPMVEAVARLGRAGATWRPALALMYAELGMEEAAIAELEALSADRFATVPRDGLWYGSLAYLADACCTVGHVASAAALYDELVGWRGLVVEVGHLLAAHGAVDRLLGKLAALLGHDREAEIHFDAALRIDAAARMPVWSAHSQLDAGTFMARRKHHGDDERARALLEAALATAERIGMPIVAAAARAELAVRSVPAGSVGEPPSSLTHREVDVLRLISEGCSNREIGRRLHISQHTAANHVRSILMKTQSANRTEAAAWALRQDVAAHWRASSSAGTS